MKTVYEREVMIPDYALSYLINGDDSGLEPKDKKLIDGWYKTYQAIADDWKGNLVLAINDMESKSYFTWNPEFGLACNVMDCTILVLK